MEKIGQIEIRDYTLSEEYMFSRKTKQNKQT